MRAAILLSGLCRSFDKTYKFLFKNIVRELEDKHGADVDIFISTWDIAGKRNGPKHHDNWFDEDSYLSEQDLGAIVEAYSPREMLVRGFEEWKLLNNTDDLAERMKVVFFGEEYDLSKDYQKSFPPFKSQVVNSVFAQSYHNHEAFNLCEEYANKNNIKYDLVMRVRFDMAFLTKIDFPVDKLENYLFIPHPNALFEEQTRWGFHLIHDKAALSSFGNMKKYCSYHLNVEDSFKSLAAVCEHGNAFGAEWLLSKHIHNCGLEARASLCDYAVYDDRDSKWKVFFKQEKYWTKDLKYE